MAWLRLFELSVYGADDGAALRDILFTWWEQTFIGAAESGAPGDRRQKGVRRRELGSILSGLCGDDRFGESGRS
ncbi:MAG: hypothetical protein WAN05_01115 [Roseiarcus sp.]